MAPADLEAGFHETLRLASRRVGRRPGRLRIQRDDDHAVEFDDEGRLVRIEDAGTSLRATLDLRLLRSHVRGRGVHRRLVRDPKALDDLDVLARAHAEAAAVLRDADRIDDLPTRRALERAARWDAAALARDRARLHRILAPVPVLPPDQYAALVVQLTEGCPWDRCTFCDLYRGVRHRVRTDEEVVAHVEALLEHLGGSVSRFRRVFLGQANALLIPPDDLRRRLDLLRDRLPESLHAFHSFVDAFHRRPTADDLRPLRRRGLRRVYVGVESGSPAVLGLLGKPIEPSAVESLVGAFRGAGIGVGVILLVGAGGKVHADEHRRASRDLVRRLDLGRGDQIHLSRLVGPAVLADEERSRAEDPGAFAPAQLESEEARFREELDFVRSRDVTITSYDLERMAQWSPRAAGTTRDATDPA